MPPGVSPWLPITSDASAAICWSATSVMVRSTRMKSWRTDTLRTVASCGMLLASRSRSTACGRSSSDMAHRTTGRQTRCFSRPGRTTRRTAYSARLHLEVRRRRSHRRDHLLCSDFVRDRYAFGCLAESRLESDRVFPAGVGNLPCAQGCDCEVESEIYLFLDDDGEFVSGHALDRPRRCGSRCPSTCW